MEQTGYAKSIDACGAHVYGRWQMSAQLRVVDLKNMASATERQKALDAALAQIDRASGKGSAMKLGSREAMEIVAISSGSLRLDIALGHRSDERRTGK